jgi:hypothetical protein
MTDPIAADIPEGIVVEREQVTDEELRRFGVDIGRDFPGSTAADFRRYPVMSEGGWFVVVKHQPTLRSVHREPWTLLGPVALASSGLDIK